MFAPEPSSQSPPDVPVELVEHPAAVAVVIVAAPASQRSIESCYDLGRSFSQGPVVELFPDRFSQSLGAFDARFHMGIPCAFA